MDKSSLGHLKIINFSNMGMETVVIEYIHHDHRIRESTKVVISLRSLRLRQKNLIETIISMVDVSG